VTEERFLDRLSGITTRKKCADGVQYEKSPSTSPSDGLIIKGGSPVSEKALHYINAALKLLCFSSRYSRRLRTVAWISAFEVTIAKFINGSQY
jgi:hypothetical protein